MQITSDDDPLVSVFDDLLAALGCKDVRGLVESLDDELEPYPSDFDVTPDASVTDAEDGIESRGPRLVIDVRHDLYFDTATIELAYPFRLSAFHAAVAWCDDFEWTHNSARESVGSHEEATLNDPDGVDYTEAMADWLGATTDNLREALGGSPWFQIDGPDQDFDGKRIHGWYAENTEPSTVAIGIGGHALYVQPLAWDGDTPELAEWPEPSVCGAYYAGTIKGTLEHPAVDVLAALSAALDEARRPTRPASKRIGPRPTR